MKKQILCLLTGLAAVAAGCMKTSNDDVTPVLQPQGKFSGTFQRIHYAPATKKYDTVKLNFQLELVSNTFKVTGDTTKHAGSNGTFGYNTAQIQWIDVTVPTGSNALNLPKYHLYGNYNYAYDGTALKFEAFNDTLKYYYDLKKTTN